MTDEQLIQAARSVAGEMRLTRKCSAADVGAAILTSNNNVYTGMHRRVVQPWLCAEHAAVAEMVKGRESQIAVVVAVDDEGKILSPCSRTSIKPSLRNSSRLRILSALSKR